MNKKESIIALIWLPIHIILLPYLLEFAIVGGYCDEAQGNLAYYVVSAAVLSILLFKFLRREIDPFFDNALGFVWKVLICYGVMWGINLIMSSIISIITLFGVEIGENLNNEAIMEMTSTETGKMKAIAYFLAPISEELMFRGGVFSTIKKKSRIWAYIASIVLFSAYHVVPYALSDITYLPYMILYFPASYVLCRCYEQTKSIWGSIMLHAMINYISMAVLSLYEGLL